MRIIHTDRVRDLVETLFRRAATDLQDDVESALLRAGVAEKGELGRVILGELVENERLARKERIPICQDCGLAVLFMEVGQEVCFEGPGLMPAIDEGVRRAYLGGFLRKMSVQDPIYERKITGDNTPAIVHSTIVPGEGLKLIAFPKGMGSENAGSITMLRPGDGEEGVFRSVLQTVDRLGANACPPLVVGVGIGANFEGAPLLAKRALLRPLGSRNPDPRYADLELRLLGRINGLGIGPAGYGGTVTALDVHVEFAPTHLAGLPIAVNLCCHACRRAEGSI
jgi:fumarate hydratase subunit alpha